ncbi:MAG: BrnA antitoxin family protein [Candidatus Accumulibacter sp.]|nr:BrnA antitoxin family protein [Accumulibacter sp.]
MQSFAYVFDVLAVLTVVHATRGKAWRIVSFRPASEGKNDDDRPLTREEMQAGIEAYRKQRGRPAGSGKESTTIRFDRDVLAAFRAAGPGWQTRMNAALRDWLKDHSPA